MQITLYNVDTLKFAVLVLAICSVLLIATISISAGNRMIVSTNFDEDTTNQIFGSEKTGWTLNRNGYDPLQYFTKGEYLTYSFLDGCSGVIEPGADMNLYLSDTSSVSEYGALEYAICDIETDDCVSGVYNVKNMKSTSFNIDCTPFDVYNVNITYKFIGQKNVDVASFNAMCMYVRREIRSLSDADLNATMNAMATLWYTNEEDGRLKYGDNFHNSSYFTLAHYYGASHRDADHIHEGVGFLPQHMKLSNMFELALQAVDQSVSLPYWDSTIDQMKEYGEPEFFIFQPETFGTLVYPNEEQWTYRSNSIDDGKIPDGRWANLRVEFGSYFESTGEIEPNLYGTLRGPWNFNPSPYITRFPPQNVSLPSCSDYYNWLSIDTLSSFLMSSDVQPHTGTHDTIGGVFGCDNFDFMITDGWVENTDTICFKWGTFMKDLWRTNFIYPDESCIPDATSEAPTCGFKCDSDRLDDMLDELESIAWKFFNESLTDGVSWTKLQDFICGGFGTKTFFGDNRESASCGDPSFWPIHPTLDRAFQAKLIVGGFESTEWPSQPRSICFRNKCYENGVEDQYNECCTGHYEDDKFPNYVMGNLSLDGIGLTNREYLSLTDPTRSDYGMPYIYDSFTWSHCGEGEGEDVDDLLESLYLNYTTS